MENKQQHQSEKEKEKFVIKIPSFQEVVDNPHPKTTSSSIFTPSPSFSQTFNFIKNSDFYAPPPAAPPPPPPSTTPPPRYTSQEHTPSPSKSTVPSRNAILVSHRQKGNPILKHIRNVRWDFADVVCDYQLGQNACALYLSLRYHLLHPDYLYFRIRELQKNYRLRVVLCYVDVEDVIKPLLEVTKTCLLHDCSLLCGWSLEECGRYLETFKVYEHKPADLIQGQMDTDYMSRLNHSLTSIRHVNKTDVVTLGSTFGSLSHIMDASMEDLARCPGIGERKVKRLYDTFHEPFKRVVPSQPPVPPVSDPQSQGNAESSARTENEEVKEDAKDGSKRRKKEPEVTIKSALKAALSKYSDRIAKQKNKTQKDGGEDIAEGDGKWKDNENSATNASTSS